MRSSVAEIENVTLPMSAGVTSNAALPAPDSEKPSPSAFAPDRIARRR
ncbi:MAG: hypothetical protein ACLUFV_11010 [Acutalibacteraceae bacterium]